MSAPAVPTPAGLPPALLALGFAIFAVAGVLSAVYEVLLVPFRIGTVLIPIAPLLAIVSNVLLPAISYRLASSRLSAAPPVIGWTLTALVLASSRPEGDVLLPAGSTTWVSYGVLLCGLVAGVVTVGSSRLASVADGDGRFSRSARAGSGTGDAR